MESWRVGELERGEVRKSKIPNLKFEINSKSKCSKFKAKINLVIGLTKLGLGEKIQEKPKNVEAFHLNLFLMIYKVFQGQRRRSTQISSHLFFSTLELIFLSNFPTLQLFLFFNIKPRLSRCQYIPFGIRYFSLCKNQAAALFRHPTRHDDLFFRGHGFAKAYGHLRGYPVKSPDLDGLGHDFVQ